MHVAAFQLAIMAIAIQNRESHASWDVHAPCNLTTAEMLLSNFVGILPPNPMVQPPILQICGCCMVFFVPFLDHHRLFSGLEEVMFPAFGILDNGS